MFRRYLRHWILAMLLAGIGAPALAVIQINTSTNTIDFGLWSGSDVSATIDACVVSTQGGVPVGTPTPYSVRAYNNDALSTANDPFEILDGVLAVGGGAQMTIQYTDDDSGANELLVPNVYATQTNPNNAICPPGNNVHFLFSIPATELAKLAGGTHTRTMRLEALGGNGGQVKRANLTVTITIGDILQINALNDIAFGQYSGAGDLQNDQGVCIYRNGVTTYRVTANGSGIAGAFTLAGPNVGDTPMPYRVFWDDGAALFTELTTGVPLFPLNNASTLLNCNGATNAQLRVLMQQADLLAYTSTGLWSGTLTLIVAPD